MTKAQYSKYIYLLAGLQSVVTILVIIFAFILPRHTAAWALGPLVTMSFVIALVAGVLTRRYKTVASGQHAESAARLVQAGTDPDKMAEHVQATHNDDETRG